MWLAIDSGNTRIKWALVRGRRTITKTGALAVSSSLSLSASALSSLAAAAKLCDEVVISDVGGDKRRRRMVAALTDKAVCFIPPPPKREGAMRNHYRNPRALGIDRWLALLAAGKNKNKNIIVADVGTALTIDAMRGGDFVGGIIVPGAKLMRRALSQQTAMKTALTAGEKIPPPSQAAGRDTKTAISAGVAAAMSGAIWDFRHRVLPGAKIIITGGDAAALLPWLPRKVVHKPHLVLEGITRWRALRLG